MALPQRSTPFFRHRAPDSGSQSEMAHDQSSSSSDSEDEVLFPSRKCSTTTTSTARRAIADYRHVAIQPRIVPPARLAMTCYSSDDDSSDSDGSSDGGIFVGETGPEECGSEDDSSNPSSIEFGDTQPDDDDAIPMSNPCEGRCAYVDLDAFSQQQRTLQAILAENVVQLQEAITKLSIEKDLLQEAISKPLPDKNAEITELSAKDQLHLTVTTPLLKEVDSAEIEEDGRLESLRPITDLREVTVREILGMITTPSLYRDERNVDIADQSEDLQSTTINPLPKDLVGVEQLPAGRDHQVSMLEKLAIFEKTKKEERNLQRAIATRLPEDNIISRAGKVKSTLRQFSTRELHEALWGVESFYIRNKRLFFEEGMTQKPDYRRTVYGDSVNNLVEGPSRREIADEMQWRELHAFLGVTPTKLHSDPNDYLGSETFEELLKVRAQKAKDENVEKRTASRTAVDASPMNALARATRDFSRVPGTTEPQMHRKWLAHCCPKYIIAPAIEALERVRKYYGPDHHLGILVPTVNFSGDVGK